MPTLSAPFTVTAPLAAGAAFLVIAGITVPVMEGQATQRTEESAEGGRAYAGNLRSAVGWAKRVWTVSTGLLTNAEGAALESATALRAQVTVTGVITMGAPVVCEVQMREFGYINTGTTDGTGVLRTYQLTIREV